jgi:hypothetical protein
MAEKAGAAPIIATYEVKLVLYLFFQCMSSVEMIFVKTRQATSGPDGH